MKHAGAVALAELSQVLEQLRAMPGLAERKPGIFYRGAVAFLHFHEDPSGLFADVKVGRSGFDRLPVGTLMERQTLVRTVRAALADRVKPGKDVVP